MLSMLREADVTLHHALGGSVLFWTLPLLRLTVTFYCCVFLSQEVPTLSGAGCSGSGEHLALIQLQLPRNVLSFSSWLLSSLGLSFCAAPCHGTRELQGKARKKALEV